MPLHPIRLALALASLPTASPVLAPSASAQGSKFEPPGDTVYHGASLNGVWSDRLNTEIAGYSKVAGKKLSIVTWFASYYENGGDRPTSWKQNYLPNLYRVQRAGAMSLIKFSTQDNQYIGGTGKIAKMADIAAGKHDSYFQEFADTIKLFGTPVFISIDHEMNGNWYPYSEGYTGPRPVSDKASDFVAAWRRIVGIFKARGVQNVAWVWSPNVPEVNATPSAQYYPGDDVVDWVGASFYSGNRTDNLRPFYLTYAPKKPIFITEWATGEKKTQYYPGGPALYPGDAAWVRSFFKSIETNYPRVKAISWFNLSQADGNYLLDRNAEQAQSYNVAIKKPRYIDQAGPRAGTETPDRPPLIPDGRETVQTEAPRATRPPTQRITMEPVKTETIRVER